MITLYLTGMVGIIGLILGTIMIVDKNPRYRRTGVMLYQATFGFVSLFGLLILGCAWAGY